MDDKELTDRIQDPEHQNLLIDVARLWRRVSKLEEREEKALENMHTLIEAVELISNALKVEVRRTNILRDQTERQADAIRALARWNKNQSIVIEALLLTRPAILVSAGPCAVGSPQSRATERSRS